ncbi:hypothetical protein [Lysinibacillus fusiformis]|uniref:hypothetical protein n=1 Tax=Lysinibacillus fusiformis TaxID=28031 RepID=UPI001967EBCB|nr:hypothetical protein [Lysinibacillus fusiformis]QSB09305.1 hypothetical protein JTI58_20215 [Lysinibacillus fusiformis]UXJ70912.1 hypothetical protein N5069_10350 [Lysinibacillus fusiformis]
MIFDMTDYNSNIKSLVDFLDLTEEEISDFVLESTDVIEFLEAFNIEDEKLLEKDIDLVSLHSTASIDNCKSIKEKGIINLQDAVSQKNPIGDYLKNKDIQINIDEKYILFKGNKLDISKETKGFCLEDEDEYRNRVIHKFYGDFQINGFLSHRNVLTYGGNTRKRPEILFDLARFLKDEKIELDWVKDKNNKHYIIKFKQPLNYYIYFTFEADWDSEYGITKDNLEYLPNEIIEAKVKKWVIQKSLNIVKDGVYELYSYVNPKVKIEPKDIMEIITEQEYISRYKIMSDY